MYISSFHHIKPRYKASQEQLLDWIARAHEKSGQDVKQQLFKLGLGPEKIEQRYFEIPDIFCKEWSEMPIYPLDRFPQGVGLDKRCQFFDAVVSQRFEEFYPEHAEFPEHLIHVTCTGYTSPSGAQKIVSKRNAPTTVTHAYHMGCYGYIPALRMARGFSTPTDIVHTEVCSLHMNPARHATDQLVVQSLFADGFIKYHVSPEVKTPSFKILVLHEQIIPETLDQMTWRCEDWGHGFSLSKEIPVSILRALPKFLEALSEKSGKDLKQSLFAIHPGGPKILSQIGKLLQLEPGQLRDSEAILKERGNMSSATLPHIWERILNNQEIPSGTLITSLAFGPGLTIGGGVFEKCTS